MAELAWYRQNQKPRNPVRREKRGSLLLGPEDCIQYDFFAWVNTYKVRFWQLDLIFAIPNGSNISKTQRAVMQATGLRSGVPDVCVPIFRLDRSELIDKACIALWIEFKSDAGKLSSAQKEWKEKLELAGHRVEIHRSWITAANVVIEYLNLPLEKIPE